MDNPLSGLTWLYVRKGRTGSADDLLRRLGRGEIELTHKAFHTLEPWRAAAHLRELLMSCGMLPTVDKQICSFERWLVGHLADITDPDHAQLVRRFATWEVLPRLRTRAETKPITPAGRRHAGDQLKHAAAFLQWLAEHGLALPTCRQTDIDAWHVKHNQHGRNTLRAFLLWCMANKLTTRFRLPTAVIRQATPLPQHKRDDLLGRLLTDHDLSLRTRVAATIVLLYAQPLSRIVRLTIDDVVHDGDQVLLRLGEPPSPVPRPIADLLLDWIENRDNMNTATNRDSRWLFPGRRAGQPMHPETLAAHINGIGIPTVAGRAAAIRQHVLEMPAPVVADALGYHPVTTAKLAVQAGGTWSRYATGDHLPVTLELDSAENPRQLNRRAHQYHGPPRPGPPAGSADPPSQSGRTAARAARASPSAQSRAGRRPGTSGYGAHRAASPARLRRIRRRQRSGGRAQGDATDAAGHLGNHSDRRQSGQSTQIHCGLGVPRAR